MFTDRDLFKIKVSTENDEVSNLLDTKDKVYFFFGRNFLRKLISVNK